MIKKCNSYLKDVLKFMQDNGRITSVDAISFGCTRLSGVIYRLKQEGYNILTQREVFKNRHGNTSTYAVYMLVGDKYERKETSKRNKNRSKK